MKKLRFFTLSSFLLFAQILFAQDPTFFNYTNGQDVHDVVFDDDFAWIATTGGLVKFNLVEKTSIFFNRSNSGLPINHINDIELDENGLLWLGTYIGLVSFDGTYWQLYNPISSNPEEHQMAILQVEISTTGDFWLRAAGDNLWKFDGQNWTSYDEDALFGGDVADIDVRPDGMVYVGLQTFEFGLFAFDGITATEIKLPVSNSNISWKADLNGDIWFLSDSHFLGIPLESGGWDIQELDFFSDNFVLSEELEVWMADWDSLNFRNSSGEWAAYDIPNASAPDELFLSPNDGVWLNYETTLNWWHDGEIEPVPTSNSGLRSNQVIHLALAGEQTIWASHGYYWHPYITAFESLSRFSNGEWERVDPSHFVINAIAGDETGNAWVGSSEKLLRYNNNGFEVITGTGLNFDNIHAVTVAPSTQEVWLGGMDGKIARYDGSNFELFDTPYIGETIVDIEVDPDGKVWVVPYNSLSISFMENGVWTTFVSAELNLPEVYWPTQLEISPTGEVWFAVEGGLTKYNGEEWQSWSYPMNSTNYLVNIVSAITFSQDSSVWLGYFHNTCFYPNVNLGLTKIKEDIWTNYWFLSTGLPYPNITSLESDTYGNIWVGLQEAGVAIFNENGPLVHTDEEVAGIQLKVGHIEIFPNPASSGATVQFGITQHSEVMIDIFSMNGTLVRSESLGNYGIGEHTKKLDTADLAQGIYLVGVKTIEGLVFEKLVVK